MIVWRPGLFVVLPVGLGHRLGVGGVAERLDVQPSQPQAGFDRPLLSVGRFAVDERGLPHPPQHRLGGLITLLLGRLDRHPGGSTPGGGPSERVWSGHAGLVADHLPVLLEFRRPGHRVTIGHVLVLDKMAHDQTPRIDLILESPAEQAKLGLGAPGPGAHGIGELDDLYHSSSSR